ncbi:MAG: phosphoadenylyl-sulfate reductase [Planctomycetes bacterium]|nr:phosphoadenylyl-sulfate reductase [Planctomycetota bacterium]
MAIVEYTTEAQQAQARLAEAAQRLDAAPPQDILRWAVENYRGAISLACSFGMQSVAIIDMLAQGNWLKDVEVFYLDTGVLFAETHQTRLKIQQRYGFRAIRVSSDMSWEEQQQKFGGHLYERGVEGVNQCCEIRKNEPTRRYLTGKKAWITGMRRAHSSNRSRVGVVGWDAKHELVKINPVAAIDDATIWGYIKANNVPYNPLYDQGYPSIGCNTPVCTRPVAPGEDPRAGRWAGMSKTECGIHLDGQQIKSLDGSQL